MIEVLENLFIIHFNNNMNWIGAAQKERPPISTYEKQLFQTNIEVLVTMYLDKIFWKILILMSKNVCRFDLVMY